MKSLVFALFTFSSVFLFSGCSSTSNVDTGGYFSTSAVSSASNLHPNGRMNLSVTGKTNSSAKAVISTHSTINPMQDPTIDLGIPY